MTSPSQPTSSSSPGPPQPERTEVHRHRASGVGFLYVALGVLASADIVIGLVGLTAPWAITALVSGIVGGAFVGAGAAQRAPLLAVYGLLCCLALGLAVAGWTIQDTPLVAAGLIAFVTAGSTAPIAVVLLRGAKTGKDSTLARAMEAVNAHTMLSDNAKRVLFRDHEIGLLRDAIEHDIGEGRYLTAMTLCTELADVFGDHEEAEHFRARILEANHARYEDDARIAMDQLDQLLAQRNWQAAHVHKTRIERMFAESHLVRDLDRRVEDARCAHKHELEITFRAAADREDVEMAMTTLRGLDVYLSSAEAEELRAVAEGVVAKYRDQLGVRFKVAVGDKNWAHAAEAGEIIISEYPNSKMADEVRSMIDLIRTRATQAAAGGRHEA